VLTRLCARRVSTPGYPRLRRHTMTHLRFERRAIVQICKNASAEGTPSTLSGSRGLVFRSNATFCYIVQIPFMLSQIVTGWHPLIAFGLIKVDLCPLSMRITKLPVHCSSNQENPKTRKPNNTNKPSHIPNIVFLPSSLFAWFWALKSYQASRRLAAAPEPILPAQLLCRHQRP
jgi:hypothetical protein